MNECKVLNFEKDIKETEVDWLWYPYIPYGKITIIQGDPGCGKTMLVSYILSKLSKGEIFNDEIVNPITSLYQTGEDGLADTIKPRLKMMNANCNYIYSIDEYNDPLSMQDDRIAEAIEKTNARVLVLDPIQAYIGAQVDMHRANEVRPILKHLGLIAEKYNCAIILVGHMNKGNGKAMYRVIGSIDFAACARSILTVGRVKDNVDTRVIIQTKNSLAVVGSSMAFSLSEERGFEFIGEYEIDEDDLFEGKKGNSKIDQALQLIKRLLNDGACPTTEIMDEAKKDGIGKTTMNAAKEKYGIKSIKKNDIWYRVKEGAKVPES